MPAKIFLPTAGPIGTVAGLAIIALIMLIIAANYHYLMKRFPDAGGAFTYTKKIFGRDQAILCACFLWFAYLNLLWSNAISLSLIGNDFFEKIFKFGFSYTFFGCEIYLGEIIFTAAILFCIGILCAKRKFFTGRFNTILALIFLLCGLACTIFSLTGAGDAERFYPPFSSTGTTFEQIFGIIALAPCAFMGFECISNATGEFNFKPKKSFAIMAATIISVAIFYAAMTFLTLAHIPIGFATWQEYIANLSDWHGSQSMPLLYAANEGLGKLGVFLLGLTEVAAILTSVIGFYFVTSRLLYSMAKENLMPKRFSVLNVVNLPGNAIIFIMLISLIIPFIGEMILTWQKDVLTVSAAVVYGYVSASACLAARTSRHGWNMLCGVLGVIIALSFVVMMFLPGLTVSTLMSTEAYFVLISIFALLIIFNIYSIMRRREHDAETAKSDADQIIVTKSNFLAKMLNEINPPIGAIIGYTNLALRENSTPEEMKEFLVTIGKTGGDLNEMINDLIELNALESGETKIVESTNDLFQILNDAHDKFAAQMEQKNITFAVEFSNVRNNFVRCDRELLNRVLENLIDNAFKFTSTGGKVTIMLKQLGSEIENIGNYEISVRDNGIGMHKDFSARVFEPFEREDNPSITGKGAGLGMTITKAIIDIMHGKISVFTERNMGTEFVVRLKFAIVESQPVNSSAQVSLPQ